MAGSSALRRIALAGAMLTVMLVPGAAQAAFPGENGRVAFSDTRDDPNGEIYTINADGTGTLRLTNDPGSDVKPAWSPDGQRIVFNRYSPGADIVVMNADGSGQTSLGPGYEPSWSPDGSKIVFVAIGECGDQSGGIYTMNPDGTGRAFVGCGPPGPGEDGERRAGMVSGRRLDRLRRRPRRVRHLHVRCERRQPHEPHHQLERHRPGSELVPERPANRMGAGSVQRRGGLGR